MNLPFSAKAEPKADRIIRKYGYAIVECLEAVNAWGDCQVVKEVKCTTLWEVECLYDKYYDIHIYTPSRCNY